MINWRDLEVIDCEGESLGQLRCLICRDTSILKMATIVDGTIESWDGFYLADPNDDVYSDDINSLDIDWTGFSEAIRTDED